jgi:hypothetical protein
LRTRAGLQKIAPNLPLLKGRLVGLPPIIAQNPVSSL